MAHEYLGTYAWSWPKHLSLVLVLFLCLGFGPLEMDEQSRSLAYAPEIHVVVKIGLSKEGPTRQTLQADVENKLREANVALLNEELFAERKNPPASLYIEVAVWKMTGRPYVYFIHANFYQSVQLVGKTDFMTQAATWQTGLIGEGDLERIRQDVSKIADIFLISYKMNKER